MGLIDGALSANPALARGFDPSRGKPPRPRIAIVTCADPRLTESHPWISPEVPVRGFVYDVSTGLLSEVQP
jgi:carbonic anhydrase